MGLIQKGAKFISSKAAAGFMRLIGASSGKAKDSVVNFVRKKFNGMNLSSFTSFFVKLSKEKKYEILRQLVIFTAIEASIDTSMEVIKMLASAESQANDNNDSANQILAELQAFRESADRLSSMDIDIHKADGSSDLSIQDAVILEEDLKTTFHIADMAKENNLVASVDAYREARNKVERLSKLLGLSLDATMEFVELLGEVKPYYKAVI